MILTKMTMHFCGQFDAKKVTEHKNFPRERAIPQKIPDQRYTYYSYLPQQVRESCHLGAQCSGWGLNMPLARSLKKWLLQQPWPQMYPRQEHTTPIQLCCVLHTY